jgi:hypothetical protein
VERLSDFRAREALAEPVLPVVVAVHPAPTNRRLGLRGGRRRHGRLPHGSIDSMKLSDKGRQNADSLRPGDQAEALLRHVNSEAGNGTLMRAKGVVAVLTNERPGR